MHDNTMYMREIDKSFGLSWLLRISSTKVATINPAVEIKRFGFIRSIQRSIIMIFYIQLLTYVRAINNTVCGTL